MRGASLLLFGCVALSVPSVMGEPALVFPTSTASPTSPTSTAFAVSIAPAPSAASPAGGPATGAVVRYAPPLAGPLHVLTPFDPPATPYGPGHRGVDLAAAQGARVGAAASGVVSFAGSVAGRGVVVVVHRDGISTEYEPIRPVVRAGDTVSSGMLLGTLAGRHAACAPASCLHWGARRDGVYLNPLDLLRALGPVRLLPWRG